MQTEHKGLSPDTSRRSPAVWLPLAGIIIFFFFGLIPAIAGNNRYHGDERFYTDAALRMVVTGDYITPYFSDGSLRFTKPALIYWIISMSYHIFGISLMTSRLPSLITGALTLWLTYKMAFLLFGDRETGIAAAAFLASNVSFITISGRSTPDILLVFLFTISLYGFAGMIFAGRHKPANFLLAYAGAGASVAAKGFMGIFPVIYCWIFSLARRRRTTSFKKLIRLQYIALGAFIGIFWFAAVMMLHGPDALKMFFADQIAEKVAESKWQVFTNFASFSIAPLRHFLPWSLIAIVAAVCWRDMFKTLFRERREQILFIIGALIIFLLIFSGSEDLRTRYLAPIYPLISSFIAAILIRTSRLDDRAHGFLRKFNIVLMGIILIPFLAISIIGSMINPLIFTGGIILSLIIVALLIYVLKNKNNAGLVALAIIILAGHIVDTVSIRGTFSHSPSRAMAERISRINGENIRIGAIGLNNHYPAQLRLYFKGRKEIKEFPKLLNNEKLDDFDILLVSEYFAEKLDQRGYRIEKCGFEYESWSLFDILELISKEDKESKFEDKKVYFYIAVEEDE